MNRPQQELIRSGGFSGGVSAGAAQGQSSGLTDLANALGVAMPGIQKALVQRYTDPIDKLRAGAEDEAERIKATFAGYNAQQIGEALESEPLAQEFKKNPYILPALKVHQGRILADDLAMEMVNIGINPGDQKAVSEFMQERSPKGDDKFLARGFNEQIERHRAQYVQQQVKDQLQELNRQRTEVAGREFFTVLEDGGSIQDAMDGLMGAEDGLDRLQKTDVAISVLRRFAQEGRYEDAVALANATRTPIKGEPMSSLAEDGNVADTVAMILKQAENQAYANDSDRRVRTYNEGQELVWEGKFSTEQALKKSQQYLALESDPQAQGMLVRQWQSWIGEQRRKNERARGETWRATQTALATAEAIKLVETGQGEYITDINLFDEETGASVSLSASSMQKEALSAVREKYLGIDTPLTLDTPEKAAAFRKYAKALTDSNLIDQDNVLKGALNGARAYLTPETITGKEQSVVTGWTLWRELDEDIAASLVKDPHTRAVYMAMQDLYEYNPGANMETLAIDAVTQVGSPFAPARGTDKPIKEAVQGITIKDYGSEKGGWFFGIGKTNEKVTVGEGDEYVAGLYAQAYNRHMNDGYGAERSAKLAELDLKERLTSVNGQLVEVPGWGLEGESPKTWNRTMHNALKALAKRNGMDTTDTSGFRIVSTPGSTYRIHHDSFEAPLLLSAAQVRGLGAAYKISAAPAPYDNTLDIAAAVAGRKAADTLKPDPSAGPVFTAPIN